MLHLGPGIFGVDAGGITPLVIVLCSLGFGLAGARVHSLAVSPGWWEVQEEDAAAEIERVAALEPSDPSLELAEQGPEQGRVGA